MQRRLAADGIMRIGQLAALDPRELARRYGRLGLRLAQLARGEDDRAHRSRGPAPARSRPRPPSPATKPMPRRWRGVLWPLCEKVAARLKQSGLAAGSVTLKLKTADFRLRTRSRRLADPTQLADTLYRTARLLLAGEADGATLFRLIGVGADSLVDGAAADLPTLFDTRGRPPPPARTGDRRRAQPARRHGPSPRT